MSTKSINLLELDDQPKELREAIAFYAAHTVLPLSFSAAEREHHYKVLEQAGYIESLGA
ncbi:hypothetical protein [Paenibacillus aceti]|uniref:Uncharacterized protein n=1 Tax=Paenibacillus aceti TaxID=1820010 RepID=A0ABQ1VPE6_9BACL|nr:hypothetical protein [Paenibacillus aceti]GGF86585.1 hypothetical protein GCM10010913_05140 [Paenibacillus aceti]